MSIKLSNNASSTTAAAISSTDTTVSVASGDGALFPVLGTDEFFYATLQTTTNNLEIVKVTARADDVMTIVRAQEGTSAIPFGSGSRFELRVTADAIAKKIESYGFLRL